MSKDYVALERERERESKQGFMVALGRGKKGVAWCNAY